VTAHDADHAHADVTLLTAAVTTRRFGGRPTLRAWLHAIVEYHVPAHTAQIEATRSGAAQHGGATKERITWPIR
jgi:hypothetical protein